MQCIAFVYLLRDLRAHFFATTLTLLLFPSLGLAGDAAAVCADGPQYVVMNGNHRFSWIYILSETDKLPPGVTPSTPIGGIGHNSNLDLTIGKLRELMNDGRIVVTDQSQNTVTASWMKELMGRDFDPEKAVATGRHNANPGVRLQLADNIAGAKVVGRYQDTIILEGSGLGRQNQGRTLSEYADSIRPSHPSVPSPASVTSPVGSSATGPSRSCTRGWANSAGDHIGRQGLGASALRVGRQLGGRALGAWNVYGWITDPMGSLGGVVATNALKIPGVGWAAAGIGSVTAGIYVYGSDEANRMAAMNTYNGGWVYMGGDDWVWTGAQATKGNPPVLNTFEFSLQYIHQHGHMPSRDLMLEQEDCYNQEYPDGKRHGDPCFFPPDSSRLFK